MSGKEPLLRRFTAMNNLDMYRKVPSDLMEGTKRGSFLSYICLLAITTLFAFETRAFLKKEVVTDVALDTNADDRIRLNFNITMMDLKCEYVVVDVVSVLGTDQNITAHVTKWHVDAAGIRQRYQGRNKQQNTLELHDSAVTETIEELHEDGEDAIALDDETFQLALNEYEYLFVDFYANWCSHCRALAPTWETLAEVMMDVRNKRVDDKHGHVKHEYSDEDLQHAEKVELPVMIGKVDCVHFPKLCQQQRLAAYPTLRLFVDGERWHEGDYRGHRTVVELADWLQQVEEKHKSELTDEGNRKVQEAHKAALERMQNKSDPQKEFAAKNPVQNIPRKQNSQVYNGDEHPGCQIAGHLSLHRAPGNFHIQARSPHHDLIPHMTNVSHMVHSLSIGDPYAEKMVEQMGVVPEVAKRKFHPMNGNAYVTQNLHEAFHHYLKVVTTSADGFKRRSGKELRAYQILQNSQLSYYSEEIVPEAKFIYDLSPIAISYRKTGIHWYDYLTSIMAIVGGAFTVFGMVESSIHAMLLRTKKIF